MSELIKYGVAATFSFTLYTPDGKKIAPGLTFLPGDVVISRDGSVDTNIFNPPVPNNAGYDVNLVVTEVEGKVIKLTVSDQTVTQTWLDQVFYFKTHGDPLAYFQVDLDELMRGTDNANTLAPDNTGIAAILADTSDMQPKLGAPAGADMSADIAVISADTNELQNDWTPGGRLDLLLNELQNDWTDGGRLDLLLDNLITQIDTPTSEPGQMAPPLSAKMALKIDFLYKYARNRSTSTATGINIYADNTSTVDQKLTHSDDGSTYDRSEVLSGP